MLALRLTAFDPPRTWGRFFCCDARPDLLYLLHDPCLGVSPMRRREFIAFLGSSLTGWPLAARAQQSPPVIGFLSAEWPDLFADRLRAFRTGLSETGYVEGRNLAVEYRWAEGRN